MPFEYLVVRSRGPGTFDPELRDQAVIRKVHIPALKDQVTQGRDEGRFPELLEPLVPRRIECVAVEMERIVTITGTQVVQKRPGKPDWLPATTVIQVRDPIGLGRTRFGFPYLFQPVCAVFPPL